MMATYHFGPFRLDAEQLLLYVGSDPLPLGPKVVETLLALVERPGDVVTKAQLLDRIWPDGYVEEANLAQNIYVIRKTLRLHWPQTVIETVPRRGYRFVAALFDGAAPAQNAWRRPSRSVAWFAAGIAACFAVAVGAYAVARPHAHQPLVLSANGARFYAMGQYYWNQRTANAIAKSERYFSAVIASDPRDPRGYAGVASSYGIAADYGYGHEAKSALLAKAAQFAQKALERDASSSQAYALLGLVALDRHRTRDAIASLQRAIALDGSNAPAHQWYGSALLDEGKAIEAYRELQKAANLDPSSAAATDWLAQAAYVSRRYADALAYGRQALDLAPQRYGLYQIIGLSYEALGNERTAIRMYQAYGRSCGDCRYDAAALEAHAYAAAHDLRNARAALAVARSGLTRHAVGYDNFMAALVALGRTKDAVAVLERFKVDEPGALLAIDPRMDALRADARFRRYTQHSS